MKLNVSHKMMEEIMMRVKTEEDASYRKLACQYGIDRWVCIAYKHFKSQKGKNQKEVIEEMKLIISRFQSDNNDEDVIDVVPE